MISNRLISSSVAVLIALSCQRSSSIDAPAVPLKTAPAIAAEVPAAAPVGAAPLSLTRNSDGTVRLKGSDRWGKQIDVTYESVDWLKKAVPVVSRGLAPEQAAQLDKDVAAL